VVDAALTSSYDRHNESSARNAAAAGARRRTVREAGGGGVGGDCSVRSPMPGTVVAVHVSAGTTLEVGVPLLAVEAMTMEHTLTAPAVGTVDLTVRVGDQVVVDPELAVVYADGVS
jgi:biotin carboxyl carrier protein